MIKENIDQAALNDALIKAARENNSDHVKQLLVQGADINAQDTSGKAPLYWADFRGSLDIHETLELLLAMGAHVNQQDNDGNSVLHGAVARGQKKRCLILLAHGADVNLRNNEGKTPLHRVFSSITWGSKPSNFIEPAEEIIKIVIDHNADINAQDNEGKTPLDRGREYGYDKVVALLKSYNKK